MANPKVKPEGKKIAEKVMEFMDNQSFDPIYEEIEKNGDDTYISEILRCFPTRRIINDLDERGELHEAYKEYVGMNGVTIKYKGGRFNKELKKWEHGVDCEEASPMFTFHSLAPAKKLIKENMDKYIDSS